MSWDSFDRLRSVLDKQMSWDARYFNALAIIFHDAGYKVTRSHKYPDAAYRHFAVRIELTDVVIVKDFPFFLQRDFDFLPLVDEITEPVSKGGLKFIPARLVEEVSE